MSRIIEQPPEDGVRSNGLYAGGWWHTLDGDERIVCDLCPRECHLKPGDRGFCFVRQNVAGEMMLTTYGKSTGFCIDPIEKKPLNHFLPGTSVLSFGTAGCNLGCKFCQNWDISKSREVERLSELAGPDAVAAAASHFDCRSVAYTYNDPIIWAEYAIDTARAAAADIKNVAVTAGYISPPAREPFFEFMDAANVDLKAFSEEFYHKITYSHLQPVLETLEWLKNETDVWFEITNLVIPDANDSPDELREMCDWIMQHVGDDVPLHFSAFHPDFRMQDRPNTPPETLVAAREIAYQQGLKFCYVGNVNDVANQSTYCPACRGLLIQRNWYELGEYHMDHNHCGHCGEEIAGLFEAAPGNWGRKRLPVNISQFTQPLPITTIPVRRKEDSRMSTASKSEGAAARLEAQRPKLSDEQQQLIHQGACEVIAASIVKRQLTVADPTLGGSADRTVMGAFVTLKRNGNLRACCGALGRPMPLGTALQQAALRTATEDVRLPAISQTELPYLDVDVSLLHGFQPINEKGESRAAVVEVGRHGLQIRRGENAGLLLPSVAREQNYNAEEFLRQLCRKAGLPATAWTDDDTEIQVFETMSIAGPFQATGITPKTVATKPLLNPNEVRALAAHCGNNIASLVQGATPSYYALGCSDGTVNGIALTLKPVGTSDSVHFFRLSMRPGMPLQSTAFELGKSIADSLSSGQLRMPSADLHVSVSILHDPAMHGSVAKADLRGIDAKSRAVMIVEGNKTAWMYDPEKTSEELLAALTEQAAVFNPEAAGVFSFAVQTNEPSMSVVNAPQPAAGPDQRPTAVAGKFYPADADELSSMVDGFLAENKGRKSKCKAIMVPHAGLVYSGNVAAAVFAKTKIPDSVIIIGPKHTRNGVEWAVAPHKSWAIPGGEVAADPELALKLVEAIPGLRMDAAAHQGEHGIEVELPFLAKLNPAVKVVGIAIGAGSMEQCQTFAAGLAKVLQTRDEETLLVISSDMNHYANDDDNRRLDEIAIKSLETLDPEQVLETVTGHGISMCGVLPAVIALEAAKQMGGLKSAKRIAYATSADVSGDKSRVVGYSGIQFN